MGSKINKVIAIMLLLVTSCVSKNEYGSCVGIQDKKDPNLEYKINWWNVAVSAIFIKAIFPPVILLWKCLECPVAKNEETKKE